MIRPSYEMLAPRERGHRAAALTLMVLLLGTLHAFDPVTVPLVGPATSCGAATGLPCIFCGITRAIHHLLNGEFARAVYFNWLAYPVVALAVALVAVAGVELMSGRRMFVVKLRWRVTPRSLAIGAAALAALWVLQVSLSLCGQKAELLNPAGPLYGLFVR